MIKAIVFDFSRVLLFPNDTTYAGSLNERHREYSANVDYSLLDYFSLNLELLDHIKNMRQKPDLYIFTSETIQDDPSLKPFIEPVFKDVFSASKLGVDKKTPSAYKILTEKIGLAPEQILFVDDTYTNIEAAESAGLKAIHYSNYEQCIQLIDRILAQP